MNCRNENRILVAGHITATNDDDFARRARELINQGRRVGESYFKHFTLGTNFRITALQAAVLLAQLERAPEQARLRERNAAFLRASLAGVSGLEFQRVPGEVTANSNYLLIGTIREREFGASRDQFQRALVAAGFPCTPFYPHTLYQNPLYRPDGGGGGGYRGCRVCPCPVSEQHVRDAFWLPHRVLLSDPATLEQLVETVQGIQRPARPARPA